MNRRIPTLAGVALLLAAGGVSLWHYGSRTAPPSAEPAPSGASQPAPAEPAMSTAPQPASLPAAPPEPLPETDWNDPLNWPLTVPVGPDGNALPPRADLGLREAPPSQSRTSALLKLARGQRAGAERLILARGPSPSPGPVRLEPIGPGTHHMSPPGGGTGSGSNYGASPGGGKSWEKGFRGEVSHGDGSYDIWDETGHWHGDAEREDGSRDSWYRDNDGNIDRFFDMGDGWMSHYDPNGDIELSGPDGSREIEHADGTRESIDPDGNRTIDLDPGGSWHGTIGPAGPDGAGNGGKGSASGIGEPHFLTFDGTGFSSQAVGEFVLATGVAGQELQARTQPWKGSLSVSAITGFAIRAGGVVIQVLADGSLRIDGALVGPGETLRYDLPDGGALGLWREGEEMKHVVLIWPDLSTLWVDRHAGYLDFSVQWRRADPSRRGLLGLEDGDAANDLTGRDGTVALAADAAQLAGFVDGWRVSDEESLFSYADDAGTADFTDLGFPYEAPAQMAADLAQSLCEGVSHPFLHEACLFDVAVTGEESFVRSASAAEKRLTILAPKDAAFAPADGICKAEGDDITTATTPDGGTIEATTTAATPRLYRIETNGGITVMTQAGISWSGAYAEGLPGYCLFDATGATIIPLTHSGSDSSFSRNDQGDIPAGLYYLKVVGTGETRLSVVTGP
ncbi:hypothetical protein [Paracoccus sp. IB05]|uniref:hypothetical protein n=1 Tax=Paracoccus sp. IB05 TaxID=2779367 RepID=UPI0018E8D0EF|nr:hypothetical protein [Paracoccus sp. IB05]MBJ2152184.1 hypothetical protein [Paracoccus sp. IB05]